MSSQQFVDIHLRGLVRQVVHAHNFNKASSKAVDIVVDLLGHYLELLTATCASFAQHAGRDAANVHDAVMALEELGMDMQDIMEWCERDGVELVPVGIERSGIVLRVDDENLRVRFEVLREGEGAFCFP